MLVKITRPARKDILESAQFIADENPKAALRFLEAVDKSIEQIRKTPGIGAPKVIGGKDVRMWIVKGFQKHLIFYTARTDEITIIRVIHSSKDYKNVLRD